MKTAKAGTFEGDVARLTYTPAEAAKILDLTELTLYRWRVRGLGPPFIRVSARTVRYPRKQFHEWFDHAQLTVQIVPKRRKRTGGKNDSTPHSARPS